jgi:hypothetical protein
MQPPQRVKVVQKTLPNPHDRYKQVAHHMLVIDEIKKARRLPLHALALKQLLA